MHGLTGGSWKRNKDRTRATEMKDTRGNPAVTSGSETYRRSSSLRQLSTGWRTEMAERFAVWRDVTELDAAA